MAVKMVTFPSQQEILTYMQNHSEQLQSEEITKNFPDATEKVAAFFANKKMQSIEILDKVSAVLLGPEKWKEEKEARNTLNEIISRLEQKSDADSIEQAKKWRATRDEVEGANPLFESLANFYCTVLKDLLNKGTFTPPGPGEKKWKKHICVVNLTNNQ